MLNKTHLSLLILLSGLLLLWPLAEPIQADLPPRPGLAQADDDEKKEPIGAYIELNLTGLPAAVWTVVQWQDSAGQWHDVDGWRGTTDQPSYRRWWVAQKDFGSGPFRWVIIADFNGPIIASSESFNLPEVPFTTLTIDIS